MPNVAIAAIAILGGEFEPCWVGKVRKKCRKTVFRTVAEVAKTFGYTIETLGEFRYSATIGEVLQMERHAVTHLEKL